MSAEVQQIVGYIALFLSSGALGYVIGTVVRQQEVREWQAIARKAQNLNRIATALQEQRNGSRQHSHQSDWDN